MSDVQNTIDLPLNEFIRIQKQLRYRELHVLGFDDGGEMMACIELMWSSQWYQHHSKKWGASIERLNGATTPQEWGVSKQDAEKALHYAAFLVNAEHDRCMETITELRQALSDLMPILRDWEPGHSTGEERQKWVRAQALLDA